jgi:hypothetical protein
MSEIKFQGKQRKPLKGQLQIKYIISTLRHRGSKFISSITFQSTQHLGRRTGHIFFKILFAKHCSEYWLLYGMNRFENAAF